MKQIILVFLLIISSLSGYCQSESTTKAVYSVPFKQGDATYMPRDWSLTYSTLPPSLPQAGLKVFISSKPR